jgi:hypothetical protein
VFWLSNIKSLERSLQKREYVKILQLVGSKYESLQEHFYVIESYLGLGRFDLAEKNLITWQNKLLTPLDWANWCYLYARCLIGLKNKIDALTTLSFAKDFLKNVQNDDLKAKIEKLEIQIRVIN